VDTLRKDASAVEVVRFVPFSVTPEMDEVCDCFNMILFPDTMDAIDVENVIVERIDP